MQKHVVTQVHGWSAEPMSEDMLQTVCGFHKEGSV